MKKIITLLLSVMFAAGSYAQECSGLPNSITPVSGTTPGLSPAPDALACHAAGEAVEDTIYFHNFSSVAGLTVDFSKIDSIENLPAGLCWKTNKSNNSFGPGEDGVIYIHGVQTGPSGQYLLRIKVDFSAGGGAINLSRYDAGVLMGIHYYLKVACSNTNCVPVNGDTINPFLPYTANCTLGNPPGVPLTSTITASGSTSFCQGDSITLTANTDSTYGYLWSTGATTSSIVVNTSGVYTVTVYSANDSAISSPVSTVVSSCHIYGSPGFYPPAELLPCLTVGQVVDDTISFINFTSISGLTVNSLRFDSIENLPVGLNWQTNMPNNTFAGGDSGWLRIQGTVTGLPGQYKLRMIADVDIGPNGVVNIHAADLEQLLHIRYGVRVSCVGGACQPYNNDTVNTFIPDTVCTYTPGAIITTYGSTNGCTGNGALLLTVNANISVGYTYKWSTGATSQSIVVHSNGIYTVTAYYGTDSAVSNPVPVTFYPGPVAAFSLLPDPNTPHVWTVVNQCSGNQLSYVWNWGDSSTSTGATPNHTYAASGYYTVCVAVTDSQGCIASYCDSNAYLYKTDAQMIQLNVVQYATGIHDVSVRTPEMSFYAGAIHFSEVVEVPTAITIYDLSGRVVTEERRFTGSLWTVNADVAAGVYVVQVRNDNYSVSKKLMLMK